MPVRMRLMRMGAKKKAFYRIVIADARAPRDGKFIEIIGTYDPHKDGAAGVTIDKERALLWLRRGVQPTEPVVRILKWTGVWDEFKGRKNSEKSGEEV